MDSNVTEDVCYVQPKSLAQRLAIGNDFIRRYHFPLPFAVDGMDNAADLAYAAWPERIYIIDERGRIVYRGGLGPFGYHPKEARAWLATHFDTATRTTSKH
jgi:Iodothyronine deiodinase